MSALLPAAPPAETPSASARPGDGAATAPTARETRETRETREVHEAHKARATPWDLPLRLFHLGLLLSVGTALVTAWVGGNAMVWHGRAGAVTAGLLGFRLAWGFVGSPTSQFRQFLPRPAALRDYLRGRWQGLGHNPLGALAVFAILGILGGQVLTGLFANDEIAFTGPYASVVSEALSLQLTGWHQRLAWGVYGLLGLHVLAIAVHEGVKRHRLVGPMFRLRRSRGPAPAASPGPAAGLPSVRPSVLPLVLALGMGAAALLLSWERQSPAEPASPVVTPGRAAQPQAW